MNLDFSDVTFDIECPECNHAFEICIKDVGNSVICPSCNQKIELVDSGISESLDNVKNQIDSLFND